MSYNRGRNGGGFGGRLRLQDRPVEERDKVVIQKKLVQFQQSSETQMTFPRNFNNHQRAAVHELCRKYGFTSKSHGTGHSRQVTVYKNGIDGELGGTVYSKQVYALELNQKAQEELYFHFHRHPVQPREFQQVCQEQTGILERLQDLPEEQQQLLKQRQKENVIVSMNSRTMRFPRNAALRKSDADVEEELEQLKQRQKTRKGMRELMKAKQKLPITKHKFAMMELMDSNRVVIIAGNTGCGKTTQVPQFIYEQALLEKKPIRVLCSQPRRISAITVANRVAQELGEEVGQTVGYQIRLEKYGGAHSSIMFCTNGVLLRMLTEQNYEDTLQNVTHVIIDEIHERDLHADFLLLVMKDILKVNQDVRLILMSATMQTEKFSAYFESCPIYEVPGAMFDVQDLYLEDILAELDYQSDLDTGNSKDVGPRQHQSKANSQRQLQVLQAMERYALECSAENADFLKQCLEYDDEQLENMDDDDDDGGLYDPQLLNFQDPNTKMTPLMMFCSQGDLEDVQDLVRAGADPSITLDTGDTAITLAQKYNAASGSEIVEFLQYTIQEQKLAEQMWQVAERNEVLLSYQQGRDENEIDGDLIEDIICKICETPLSEGEAGAVLVFLPGWDEIMKIKDQLESRRSSLREVLEDQFQVLPLHSKVAAVDQRRVFLRPPTGVRKIVLATNIAETAVTIDDVVYVINTGKLKEKSYDPYKGVSILQTEWISQASEKQRRGRAGRCQPGKCYHLYSKLRSSHLAEFQEPEMKRSALDELCLQVRLILESGYQNSGASSVKTFLSKAVEPPVDRAVDDAVKLLQDIGAFEPDSEKLTTLGRHLAKLPISPRLGKMLLFGVMFNVFDPMLTIACSISYRDPWNLPINATEKTAAETAKARLQAQVGGTSDHLLLVVAFNEWKSSPNKPAYCRKMFLSNAVMTMIDGTRSQLQQEMIQLNLVKDLKQASSKAGQGDLVRCVLACGIYPQIGLFYKPGKRTMVVTRDGESAKVHTLSTNKDLHVDKLKTSQAVRSCPLAAFDEITRRESEYLIRQNTLIHPLPVVLIANSMRVCNGDSDLKVEEDLWDDYEFESKQQFVQAETSVSGGSGSSRKQLRNLFRWGQITIDNWLPFLVPYQCLMQLCVLRLRLQNVFCKLIEQQSDKISKQEQSAVICAQKLFQAQVGNKDVDLSGKQIRSARNNKASDNGLVYGFVSGNNGRNNVNNVINNNWEVRQQQQPQYYQQQYWDRGTGNRNNPEKEAFQYGRQKRIQVSTSSKSSQNSNNGSVTQKGNRSRNRNNY